MAKRKHAAALFEVIHHTDHRSTPRAGGGVGASLSSWLRRRSAAKAKATAMKAETAPKRGGPSLVSRMMEMLPSMPRVGMDLDPDRQIVSFKLSYTTALISAFVMVAVIALAFVVGKHTNRRVTPALADLTTDELRSGPAQPDVLDVGADSAPMAMATTVVPAKHETAPTPAAPAKPLAAQTGAKNAAAPVAAPSSNVRSNSEREIGRQYVVMQCYPESEKQMADDACQYLTKNGVPCTVEFNTFYAKGWFAVVGIAGFDHIRNAPEYDSYIASINQLSDKFAEKSRFKKFDPKPIKWRAPLKPVG